MALEKIAKFPFQATFLREQVTTGAEFLFY